LWRELFGLFEQEGTILITVGLPMHKELFRALSFEHLPLEIQPIWGMQDRMEAYMLDLSRIGLEAWIEAIMAGRQPPRVLSSAEMEHAVQDALVHWREDAWLESSELAQSTALAHRAVDQRTGEDVREAIRQALQRVKADASADLALAISALERAYLERTISHERAAQELAVSRATFYRLLRRATQALARALEHA
jgi:hypothetical protein